MQTSWVCMLYKKSALAIIHLECIKGLGSILNEKYHEIHSLC